MSSLTQAIEAGLQHGRLDVLGARATFDVEAGSMVGLFARECGLAHRKLSTLGKSLLKCACPHSSEQFGFSADS